MRASLNDVLLPNLAKTILFQPCPKLLGVLPTKLDSLSSRPTTTMSAGTKLSRKALDCVLTTTCTWCDALLNNEAMTFKA